MVEPRVGYKLPTGLGIRQTKFTERQLICPPISQKTHPKGVEKDTEGLQMLLQMLQIYLLLSYYTIVNKFKWPIKTTHVDSKITTYIFFRKSLKRAPDWKYKVGFQLRPLTEVMLSFCFSSSNHFERYMIIITDSPIPKIQSGHLTLHHNW